MRTTEVSLSDSRVLEVLEDGDLDGVPVVVHHGTPGAAGLHQGWVTDARERGLRLVSYSRPGYGGSTQNPGRTVADAVPDVAALCDALGIDRFLSWGVSGGGPHVLACAALLPERAVAVASLASLGPYGADGFDFFEGMGEGNTHDFNEYLSGGRETGRASAEEMAGLMRVATVADMVEGMRPYLSEVDARELTDGLGEFMLVNTRHALSPGVEGWLDEDLVRPWGFDPADVRVPVLLWQGRQDDMVPFGHGEFLAEQIPGVEAHLSDEDGHLTLITRRIPQVHAWLLARWQEATPRR